jgi:SAM-dependent methyltransferase
MVYITREVMYMPLKPSQINLNAERERRNRKLAEAVEQIVRNTFGTVKYLPDAGNGSYIKIAAAPKRSEPVGERDLPVPPAHLWLCLEGSPDDYLDTGRADVEVMRSLLADCGFVFPAGSRVLDFGCGAGRMTRWFCDVADRCEVWGVDIQETHINWCQENLAPPFHFVTCTTLPHLPFEDRSFDLVFAAGIFPAMEDLRDGWLLELRRVLVPGGKLYLTVHDRHSIDVMLAYREGERLRVLTELLTPFKEVLHDSWGTLAIKETTLGTLVFHDLDDIRHRWGRLFRIDAERQDAQLFLTALVLSKREA